MRGLLIGLLLIGSPAILGRTRQSQSLAPQNLSTQIAPSKVQRELPETITDGRLDEFIGFCILQDPKNYFNRMLAETGAR